MPDVTLELLPMRSQLTKVTCEPGKAKIAGTCLVRFYGKGLSVIRQFLINKLPLSITSTVFISGSRCISSKTLILGFLCHSCLRFCSSLNFLTKASPLCVRTSLFNITYFLAASSLSKGSSRATSILIVGPSDPNR